MKRLLTILFLITFTLIGYGQSNTYEEVVRKCKIDFQNVLTNTLDDSIYTVLDKIGQCFIGLKFPEFNQTSIDGRQYKLSDLKGKVVMLNFWFIACAPCVEEMPLLNELHNEYSDNDFALLAFALDSKESILDFKKKKPLDYVIFENSKKLIVDTFLLTFGFPTNIILDKEGKIVEFKLGGELDKEKLLRMKAKFENIIQAEMKR
ncbi:MAG: TlpA disulfide reductase family protein [Cyclobacteriaceae bacterium]|jgi:thiol-disulfide isomerase/thioredoxin|nr:TlpA disulfide reductase family protein [Cytophagales bacterium]MCZ8329217.1 TlpA disulfide reductase family protein [Cyclobacteriaceae bacterium]